MNIQDIESFEVTGFNVRTKNSDEMDTSTAKIGELWNRFYADIAGHLSESANMYGVYSDYESDHTGMFSVLAASDDKSASLVNDTQTLEIEAGQYLVFSGSGEMPQAVIELWGKVWVYFESTDIKYARAYTTDFEYYKSPSDIEIYISIK